MSTSSLFSILVANYNNAKFFGDLFPSIMNQTYPNIEIIFVDDGSTDNSFEEIQKYAALDSRIKIFRNNKNQGCAPTKRRCIELSTGEYFGFVDPDDFIETNAVEKMINELQKDSEIALVCSRFLLRNENLTEKQELVLPHDISEEKLLMFGFAPDHFSAFSRKKYNLTQIDAAKIIHKAKGTVSKYSADVLNPDIESYLLLADYLNISLDELFERDSNFVRISKEEYDELIKVKEIINKVIK